MSAFARQKRGGPVLPEARILPVFSTEVVRCNGLSPRVTRCSQQQGISIYCRNQQKAYCIIMAPFTIFSSNQASAEVDSSDGKTLSCEELYGPYPKVSLLRRTGVMGYRWRLRGPEEADEPQTSILKRLFKPQTSIEPSRFPPDSQ